MTSSALTSADLFDAEHTSPIHATTVVLRDGSVIGIRALHPNDEPAAREFLRGLSQQSRWFRFCGQLADEALMREAHRQAHVEETRGIGLIATAGVEERIVGHAEYAGVHDGRAEVSFAIADACQGQGLATILVGQLAQLASDRGIRTFEAEVLPENHKMLAVFRESGFAIRAHAMRGNIHVEFPTAITEAARERFEERDWTAAVNAIHAFFHPRSIAVIGASRQRGSIGGEVLRNLVSYGFEGPVCPVNPNTPVVQSIVAYATVEEVPGPVDLAVLIVPADRVLETAEACGRKGVRALVVISGGFAETGVEGRARQDQLVRICRAAGMRLIGPNCMGIVNTDPAVRLNATFAPVSPTAGRVGFMSQSGALGIAVMDYASALGLGLSTFVSVGNKADISGNDLLRYWEQDPNTDAILLYLESFGNPRKFSRIARRVARRKPIVAVKSGRSLAGIRAAGSHTGALLAASDVTVDALFRSAGVIRTNTLAEMFDVASLIASQPIPNGNRVAILTNAGGPGILCADACEAGGLTISTLGAETETALRALLPREASVQNPVDMIASASADEYREAIRLLASDPAVDALVVIFIPPLVTKADDVARAIVDGVRALGGAKPVLTVFMQSRGVPPELRARDVRVPSYAFPEEAAIALSHAVRYGTWRARPPIPPAHFADVRRDAAAAVVAAALGRGDEWLTPDDVTTLLACYGLPLLAQAVVATAEEAAKAAEGLGSERVAIKAVVPGLVHKTEAGAVRLSLRPDEVESAARYMATRLHFQDTQGSRFLVQAMAPAGVEMLVGVVHDSQFGPVVAVGAGGVLVELLRDVSVRLTPLAESDAAEMLRELKTYPLLSGYRGDTAHDVRALADAILRVGALVEDLPQIAELDLNPIVVHPSGAVIVDARVRIAPSEPEPLIGARA
jgi:acetyl coenzyme A synthetase (ADP forming)-like protein